MARTNVAISRCASTHEGAQAQVVSPYHELRRSLLTCLLWEQTFYESGESIANRIAELVPKVAPEKVAALAVEARDKMYLRHTPLFLIRELARMKGQGALIAKTLPQVIQRADELAEFVSLYWKEKRQPLSAGVKRGLAAAFQKFDGYDLAKYNRDGTVKLRDVLFLCHAKPKDPEQATVWKKLVDGTLESPDTWEVELSSGKDKKATFERLLKAGKLGGLATLRNLRNMEQAGVEEALIRSRLLEGTKKALPFRFITAARYVPRFESELEQAMLKAAEGLQPLPGRTGLLVDVSGSMDNPLSEKSETLRVDAAAGLAILLREKSASVEIATFSNQLVVLPPRRGFALRDAVMQSQPHQGTHLRDALEALHQQQRAWLNLDRLIVISDEQAHDGIYQAWTKRAYVINVAPYQYGISYGNGWTHLDGWSERILDYIVTVEDEREAVWRNDT